MPKRKPALDIAAVAVERGACQLVVWPTGALGPTVLPVPAGCTVVVARATAADLPFLMELPLGAFDTISIQNDVIQIPNVPVERRS